MYDKELLKALVREKALKFGDFTLASGKKSSYYLDGKQITLDSAGAKLVAEGILELLVGCGQPTGKAGTPDRAQPAGMVGGAHPTMPDAVGGMSIGADPITAAVVTMAGVQGRAIRGFMVRKEAKGHGTGRLVEGLANLPPGSKVAVVEDTTTTGGSLIAAVDRAREAGLDVVQCVTVVEREEGAAEALSAAGLTLEALVTRTVLVGPGALGG